MEGSRLVLGAMTGTSIDGIDLALVRIEGHGLTMRARPVAFRAAALGALGPRLRAAAEQEPLACGELAALARAFGELHAGEAKALVDAAGAGFPALAAVHGQTVFHRPPVGWQLLDPHPIARVLGCTVVFDLRSADLAAGGQGAPLTPLADWVLYRGPEPTAVVNLGGFANLTALPGASDADEAGQVAAIRGGDLCPCNQVLDRAARVVLGREFDADGAVACSGVRDEDAFRTLCARLSHAGGGRSLGTGDEGDAWIGEHAGRMPAPDLLATAAEAVGWAVGTAVARSGARRAVLAGGGVRNERLVRAVAAASGCPVVASDATGIPAGMREASAWAVLGALAQDDVEIALPQVTGRRGEAATRPGTWIHPRNRAAGAAP